MYEVIYLPTAKQELEEIVEYIAAQLKAPEAVINFMDAVDDMARGLAEMPYRHPVYHAIFNLLDEVRFVPVKNYTLFYVVNEEQKSVEIRRIQYQRRGTTAINMPT